MKTKIAIAAGLLILAGLWFALAGKNENRAVHEDAGKTDAAVKDRPAFPRPPATERMASPKDGRPKRRMEGLKRVEPPGALSRKGMDVRKKGPADREEMRYIVTVVSDEPARSARSIQALLKSFGAEQAVDADKPSHVEVPRKQYRPFLQGLEKLGRLDVRRERYKAPIKGSVPIPFEIRLKRPEGEAAGDEPKSPPVPKDAPPARGPANEFGK